MQFDTPATTNPIDQLKVVGQPIHRIDGQLKTTGRAMYAYEWHDTKVPYAYGYPVGAAVARAASNPWTSLPQKRRQASSPL
ncbi:hypothetical protein AJ87_39460 [Rhizobium yanglingense]|nr:hypothetical protein AJ87_39460 [Rhizobium yanglingense]